MTTRILATVMSSLLLGAALLPGGCATSRPYYSTSYFASSAVSESDRSELVVYLDWVIRTQRAKSISIVTPEHGEQSLYPRDESSPPTIDWLPLPVLFAASYILDRKFRGEELDLYVQTAAEGLTPVSATHDLDGSVRIEMGLPRPSQKPEHTPTAQELVERFGLRAVRQESRAFQPNELRALEAALSLLSPQEQTLIRDIAFVRLPADSEASPSVKGHHIWGRYRSNLAQQRSREILLFDTPDAHQQSLFIGDPNQPYPIATLCLLHEMGHAIADYARMRVLHRQDDWLAASRRFSQAMKTTSARQSPQRDEEQKQQAAQLRQERVALLSAMDAVSEGYRTDRGPVLAVYGELDGSTRGPTPYGRTDIAESFAESFALFKADPAALRRVNPEVYRWFAQGGHLKALADVLGEGPAPLSRWSSEPGATVAQPR